jgi:GNAT superfamily N-acetyltransferase
VRLAAPDCLETLTWGGFRVERAERADRAGLEEMFTRCSERTRLLRFHGLVRAIPERYLAEALSGVPEHYALVARAPSGAVTALASCRFGASGTAELGVLVEDSSQGLGLGGFLLTTLVQHAGRSGATTVRATMLREQGWIIRLLRAHGPCETASADEAIEVTVRIRGR